MFLSLNIHEALTFETEICLHPDLFNNTNNNSNNNNNNNNSNNSNNNNNIAGALPSSTAASTSTTAPNTTATAAKAAVAAVPSQSGGGNDSQQLTSDGGGGGQQQPQQQSKPLEPGDFVEIRVWDIPADGGSGGAGGGVLHNNNNNHPRPTAGGGGGNTSYHSSHTNSIPPVANLPRRRTSSQAPTTAPPPPPPSIPPMDNAASTLDSVSRNNNNTTIMIDPSQDNTSTNNYNNNVEVNSAASSSKSELHGRLFGENLPTTPSASPRTNSGSTNDYTDETTRASMYNNTAASAVLPPPFPQNNNNNNNSSSTKPPRHIVHRGSTTSNKQLQQPPLRHSPKLTTTTRHVRELSDLSVDTTAMWGDYATRTSVTTLDNSQQLVDLQVPFHALSSSGGGASTITTNNNNNNNNGADDETTTDHGGGGGGGGGGDVDNMSSSPLHQQQQHQHHSRSSHHDHFHQQQPQHILRLKFYMIVNEASFTSLKASARTQVSLLRQVADLYNLSSYDMVTVHQVPECDKEQVRSEMAAEFVLVTIKDQYLSRGDLHYFQQSLQGSFLYEGQRLQDTSRGIQAHAREIRVQDYIAPTGIVTEHTKIAYRSRSSRIFWLVQMSAELWEYSAPFAEGGKCEIYFDKFMGFVYELFEKWKLVEATHSLTVVFFSRTFLNATGIGDMKGRGIQKDVSGRYYEDHCRLVIENETRADWDSLILQIRQAFWQYPSEVGWNLSTSDTGRWPSRAGQGNVLEAINVTLNLLQFHYLDRDLHRTGNSIVVVSGGNGVFEVSKELSQITYQRMMDNGIGSDMLSLGLPPLHTAPFFMYVKEHQAVGIGDGVDASESYFEVPHWMHLSFVSYESDSKLPTEKKASEEDAMDSAIMPHGHIEVGANGFIRRHWMNAGPPGSPLRGPTAIPPVVSPNKQRLEVPQERQLITGRDFTDILRASRPRYSASLPSAFRTLLQSYGRGQLSSSKDRDESEAVTLSGHKSSHIREWNSMESDDGSDGSVHIRGRGVSLGQDPRDGSSPILLPMSPPRVDMLDSRVSSPSSSFTTHISGGFLGSSFERQHDSIPRYLSPKLTGMQLQKARSMEFEGDEADESETIDESLGGSTLPTRIADSSNEPETKKVMDSVKSLMKTCDSSFLKVESPKHTPSQGLDRRNSTETNSVRSFRGGNLSKSPQFGPRNLSSRSVSSQPSGAVGGIGAALSQYRGSGNSLSNESESESGHGNNMARVASYGRLRDVALLRIPEMISAGMSPLLLPATQPGYENLSESMRRDRRIAESQRYGSADAGFIRPTRGRQSEPSQTQGSDRRLQALTPSSPPKLNTVKPKRSSPKTSRKKKAFNPFRQQDEDAVLAEKSHNRRRWSHVFPASEVEFKRHAGPNWKSLSAPAILPISVDYFPPQAKIDLDFRINQYSINVSDFDKLNYFSSTKFLLMEMVRQRITQDYQIVPRSNVNESNYRKEWLSRQAVFNERPNAPEEDEGDQLRVFLSMGHRLQVLSYVPSADTVHVTQYRMISDESSFKYHYNSYSPETGAFVKTVQSFQKYSSPYNWNKVDRILSGDTDRELREGMRVKRIMFLIIPDKFTNKEGEDKYIAKFKRLSEYFEKLRPKDEADVPLNVRIVDSSETSSDESEDQFDSTPGIEGKSMVRFYVPLRKGRRDQCEYTELAIDATFNTAWSYRVIVNWLAASTTKIETQVQSLQRRCTQYGLTLIAAPQLSVSRSVFLNPFRTPLLFSVRDRFKVPTLYTTLAAKDYIHDGVFPTEASTIAECIEDGSDFKFRRYGKLPHARQFLHRSGTLFVRIVVDRQGWALIVVFANSRHIARDKSLHQNCCSVLRELRDLVESLQ